MSKRHEHRSRSRLSDVAARAGVSAVTVSRAIRHPEMVTPKLRKRIEKAIHDLAYVPNRAASMLASSRTQLIGVVVSSLTNGVFADYLRALHDLLLPEGLQVMVLDSRYVPRGRGNGDRHIAWPASRGDDRIEHRSDAARAAIAEAQRNSCRPDDGARQVRRSTSISASRMRRRAMRRHVI